MKAAAATTTATTTAISHSRSWAGQQTRLESVASSAAAAYVWRRHASDFLQTHTHTNNTIYTHTIPIHTQADRRAITNSVCFGFSFDAGFGFGLPNDPFVSVSESHMQTGLMCSCQIEMCTAHAAFVQHPFPPLPLKPFLGHLPICCPCTAGLKMFSIVWYIC